LKAPSFEFGVRVVPTIKAFRHGVFSWAERHTIEGVVVWADYDTVRVCRRGNKKAIDYHPSFWVVGSLADVY